MGKRDAGSLVNPKNRTAHLITEGLVIAFIEAGVEGRENLVLANDRFKQGKPTMFAASHFSNADWPLIDHTFRMLGYRELAEHTSVVQGSVLEKHRAARWLMGAYRRIPIPSSRDEKYKSRRAEYKLGLENGYSLAKSELQSGNPVGVFMGRGRSYDGVLEYIPPEIALWYQLVPDTVVIPLALEKTNERLKPHSVIPTFGRANVRVGRPIFVDQINMKSENGRRNRDQMIVDEIMDEIASLLPEKYRGYYSQPRELRGTASIEGRTEVAKLAESAF